MCARPQAKNMSEFLDRTWESLAYNIGFIFSFIRTVCQVICCLRVRKKKVMQLDANRPPPPGAAAAEPPPEKKGGMLSRVLKKAKEGAASARAAPPPRGVPTEADVAVAAAAEGDDHPDDELVEAFIRAREGRRLRAGPHMVPSLLTPCTFPSVPLLILYTMRGYRLRGAAAPVDEAAVRRAMERADRAMAT